MFFSVNPHVTELNYGYCCSFDYCNSGTFRWKNGSEMVWEGTESNGILTKANFAHVFLMCLIVILILKLDCIENSDIKN